MAFARRLGAFSGARLVLANAFRYDDLRGRPTRLAYREALREDLRRCWSRCATATGSMLLRGRSPAPRRGARAARARGARRRCASRRRLFARRPRAAVLPGSIGERLLHGSPCAVAVVSGGYRETEHEAPRRIGVGIDGGPGARGGPAPRRRAGSRAGCGARGDLGVRPDVARVDEAFLAALDRTSRARVDEAVKVLPPAIEAARVFVWSDPVEVLVQRSYELDWLLIGSRGYGPVLSSWCCSAASPASRRPCRPSSSCAGAACRSRSMGSSQRPSSAPRHVRRVRR